MFGSEILDVAIGMVFFFLVVSLICSAGNELIEAWLNKRADYLERGIKELLNDKDGKGLVGELYNHPLIAGLFRGKYAVEDKNWKWVVLRELGIKKTALPSYIPAREFALALLDITSNSSNSTPPVSPPVEDSSDSSVKESDPKADPLRALRALIEAAGGDAETLRENIANEKVRENIEKWFNGAMDRVSGWYKRRTQFILLLLGLIVTVFLNADALVVGNALLSNKALRDSTVAAAGEYVKIDAANSTEGKPPVDCSGDTSEETNLAKCKLDAKINQLKSLGLPIGWERENMPSFWEQPFVWLSKITGLKVLGLLLTSFAISLGAPFWFDLLNKFMVVRSTVKPEEKSHKEPSKDK